MSPLDLSIFANDPWWLVLFKLVMLVVVLLVWTILNVWYERRLVSKMQNRIGPIMNGPFGLLQTVAEAVKLLFKEDFRPAKAEAVLFTLAPIVSGTAAFAAWSVIPFGGEVEMFGVQTRLQLTDLPVSTLLIMAIASVGIYGFVLAGWSSSSPYSLLGSLRSSAQMISYELSMGLSLVAVFLFAGTMSTSEIVDAQGEPLTPFGIDIGLQQWYWLLLIPSFVIYVISMVAETNRAPFDLPECESELVSGHLTEYSGFRYACFFLAEYINMATVSAVATTLFLGGYHAIWPFNVLLPITDQGWFGPLWFVLKVQMFFSLFVWLRAAIPRFRYDQFMDLGWKWMIPISVLWIVAVATIRLILNDEQIRTGPLPWILVAIVAAVLIILLLTGREPKQPPEPANDKPFDAFAGGFPVPPGEGQVLPEFAGVMRAQPVAPAHEPEPETAKEADS